VVNDVFTRLVGQDRAAAAMRQYAANPVHAYLFTGPAGSSVRDALVCFAAALQCPNTGCGECEVCRLVLSEQDPDVHFAERSGVAWRVEEIREAERVSRRRPLGVGYQIVVLEDVELTTAASASAPALLKSLEEPPTRTIFLLSAEELTPGLDTIVSRCVEVRLRALKQEDLESILAQEGVTPEVARHAAEASNGNLRRARVLARDADLVTRVEKWRSVPARLTGTPAASAALAREIAAALDEAVTPLAQLQDEEMERRTSDAREMGQRAVANRREIEAQFKREQRRFRLDELRFGFSALTGVYRERLIESLATSAVGDARAEQRVGASLRAIDTVAEANRRLATNVDESLLLNDLLLSLSEF